MSDEAAEILDKENTWVSNTWVTKKRKQKDGPKRNIRIFYHPIDIRMVNNQILNVLQKHKKVTYHFLLIGLLFSGGIKNNTNQTFIVCNDLSDACDSF